MASDDYVARGGSVATATSPPWGRSRTARSLTSWLPKADTPIYKGGPPLDPVWWRFFKEVSDRLDGIRGLSIAEVTQTVTATQATLLEAQTTALQAQATATAATASIDVIREVAINNGLDGAGQIP